MLWWGGAGRQGWRGTVSMVLGRAPGSAPKRLGGCGLGVGVGAQIIAVKGLGAGGGASWFRLRWAGRRDWR